jgi:hypothetical protein
MRTVQFLGRLTRVVAYLWLAGCLGFFLLGIVLTFWPFPVAWPGPVPWSLQSDFVETPDGRILVCLRYFCEVRCYDRSGSFVRAYPFPKTAGSGFLAVGEDDVVYLYGIGYWDQGSVYAYDANWNLVSEKPHGTVGSIPFPWELSAQQGQLRHAPNRRDENRVDRVARRGDLIFSRTNVRSVFQCADGGTLERHGQTLVRRSAAGDVRFTCGEPLPVPLCALPWPGYLAFLTVIGLWLAKRMKPTPDDLIGIRPRRISARDNGARLRIAWCWCGPHFANAVGYCLAWNGFLVFWLIFGLQTEAAWGCIFFGTPHLLMGALLLYVTLALLVNRTVIKATHEFLTVWNGPMPWIGNRKLAVAELVQLYFQQDPKKNSKARGSYRVYGLKKDGVNIVLLEDLARNQAQFIVQKLARRLTLDDGQLEYEMKQDDSTL